MFLEFSIEFFYPIPADDSCPPRRVRFSFFVIGPARGGQKKRTSSTLRTVVCVCVCACIVFVTSGLIIYMSFSYSRFILAGEKKCVFIISRCFFIIIIKQMRRFRRNYFVENRAVSPRVASIISGTSAAGGDCPIVVVRARDFFIDFI